jgi:hypothetical protein
MTSKFDKTHISIKKIDDNKIKEAINKADDIDTQELLQYSLINKI